FREKCRRENPCGWARARTEVLREARIGPGRFNGDALRSILLLICRNDCAPRTLFLHRAGPARGERAVVGEESVGHDKEASWNLRRACSSAPSAAALKAPADLPARRRPMTAVLGRAFAMRSAAPAAVTAYPRISASDGTA